MIEFADSIIEGTGKSAAVAGFSNELIVLAVLMTRYPNSSKVDMPLASYDLIIERQDGTSVSFLRAQVKTATKSIPFVGGSRGGVDRSYDPSTHQSKRYVQDPTKSDLVIGIRRDLGTRSTQLFLVPTLIIPYINQTSLSTAHATVFSDWAMINLCDKEDALRDFLRHAPEDKIAPLKKTKGTFGNWLQEQA